MDENRKIKIGSWGSLFSFAILSSFCYIFSEWVFIATKPSFMDQMPLGAKLGILFNSAMLLIGASLLFVLLPFMLSLAPWWSNSWRIFLWIGCIVPAVLIAATALMMIDNFTYTVFKFGVVSTQGLQRGIYGVLFLFFSLYLTWRLSVALRRETRMDRLSSSFKLRMGTGVTVLVLAIVPGVIFYFSSRPTEAFIPNTGPTVKHPNILLIGSDGIDADHLSLYGYGQETTPFLDQFAQTALLAENNFTNANMTTGSHVSMLTGKLPTATRTLFPPDILQGVDAYQHLPGILKGEGYYNVQISVDFYGDANAVNLKDGFASVNGRSYTSDGLYILSRRYVPEDSAYFLSAISKRLFDRIDHIFYIRTMVNPIVQVTEKMDSSSDRERINQTISLFQHVQQPLFIHVYMMGTHQFMYENYDDAIRGFDSYVREVTEALEQMGKLDNTMIVVYTDHGQANVRNIRTPLIIHFPEGEYAGKIDYNTQNLDIAPTILDYIGIRPPDWMSGQSLLRGEPPATRPIFSAIPNYQKDNGNNRLELDLSKIKPPFYQFGIIDMVICHKWYSLDTSSFTWQEGDIASYPTPCSSEIMPDERQAQRIMLDQLKKDGFDIASLETALSGE